MYAIEPPDDSKIFNWPVVPGQINTLNVAPVIQGYAPDGVSRPFAGATYTTEISAMSAGFYRTTTGGTLDIDDLVTTPLDRSDNDYDARDDFYLYCDQYTERTNDTSTQLENYAYFPIITISDVDFLQLAVDSTAQITGSQPTQIKLSGMYRVWGWAARKNDPNFIAQLSSARYAFLKVPHELMGYSADDEAWEPIDWITAEQMDAFEEIASIDVPDVSYFDWFKTTDGYDSGDPGPDAPFDISLDRSLFDDAGFLHLQVVLKTATGYWFDGVYSTPVPVVVRFYGYNNSDATPFGPGTDWQITGAVNTTGYVHPAVQGDQITLEYTGAYDPTITGHTVTGYVTPIDYTNPDTSDTTISDDGTTKIFVRLKKVDSVNYENFPNYYSYHLQIFSSTGGVDTLLAEHVNIVDSTTVDPSYLIFGLSGAVRIDITETDINVMLNSAPVLSYTFPSPITVSRVARLTTTGEIVQLIVSSALAESSVDADMGLELELDPLYLEAIVPETLYEMTAAVYSSALPIVYETWPEWDTDNPGTLYPTMWVRIVTPLDHDSYEIWSGWSNTDITTLTYNLTSSPVWYSPITQLWTTADVWFDSDNWIDVRKPWVMGAGGEPRQGGTDPVVGADYGEADQVWWWNRGTTEHIRIMWDPAKDPTALLTLVPRPVPKKMRPPIWRWPAGADHYSLDDQFTPLYPGTPMADVSVREILSGAAIMLQDSRETYAYGTRNVIFGWTEQTDFFHYATEQADGGLRQMYLDEITMSHWGDIGQSGSDGAQYSAMDLGPAWTWNGVLVPGGWDPQQAASRQYPNKTAKKNARGEAIPPYISPDGVDSQELYVIHDLIWIMTSPQYPDSYFVQWSHLVDGQPVGIHCEERDKRTHDVIRSMAPCTDPGSGTLGSGPSYNYPWRAKLTVLMDDGVTAAGFHERASWNGSYFSFSPTIAYYNLETETSTFVDLPPAMDAYRMTLGGIRADGTHVFYQSQQDYPVFTWHPDSPSIFNTINLQNYYGNGYNGGCIGVTHNGRYAWYSKLNSHGLASSVLAPNGQHYYIGYGRINMFTELYRYDLIAGATSVRTTIRLIENSHSNTLKLEALFPDGSTYEIPNVNTPGYTGVEVEIGTWMLDEVRWRFSDLTTPGVWTEVDNSHIERSATSGADWTGYQYFFDDNAGGVPDGDFNDLATEVRYYTTLAEKPIEWIANFDSEDVQSYGRDLSAHTSSGPTKNILSMNSWFPTTTDGFANSAGGYTSTLSVPTSGVLRAATRSTPTGIGFETSTGRMLYPYTNSGIYQYYTANCRVRYVSGGTSGILKSDLVLYAEGGGSPLFSTSSGGRNISYIASYAGAWVDMNSDWVGAWGYPTVSQMSQKVVATGISSDLVLEFENLGVIDTWDSSIFLEPTSGYPQVLSYVKSGSSTSYLYGLRAYDAYFYPEGAVGYPLSAGLRKPPSQRNPEFAPARQMRALQTMAPGSARGRVTNAGLTPASVSRAATNATGTVPDIVFSHPGPPVDNVASGPYRVTTAVHVSGVHATLGTMGSTATTVTVTKNGATLTTITIPGGATVADTTLDLDLAAGDLIRVVATSVGTGAQNLTVQLKTS